MPQKPTKQRTLSGGSQDERDFIKAGKAYAKALQESIEAPTPENNQAVLEAGRTVMLRAAGFLPQDTLRRMGEIQRGRMMKDG